MHKLTICDYVPVPMLMCVAGGTEIVHSLGNGATNECFQGLPHNDKNVGKRSSWPQTSIMMYACDDFRWMDGRMNKEKHPRGMKRRMSNGP